MKPIGSAITGTLKRIAEVGNSTGLPDGERGSGALQMADESVRRDWLLKRAPAETDRAMRASLISPSSAVVSQEMIDRDRQRVEAVMIAATYDQAEEWLVALQAATAGGKRSEASATVALDLYAGCLLQFPADVAKAACVALALSEDWFPPLAKLNAKCEALVEERVRMLAAIRKWEPDPDEPRHTPKLPDDYDPEALNAGHR